ncbi:MAG: outer membrane protein OmpA-like peptidoglycan-associated protein, partial [Myxococcota bacterium]
VGGGLGLTQGFGSPDFRVFLSFGYVPRCVDNDGDQICNEDDKCPAEPEDFDGFKDDDGCPDLDNDEDGIPDVSDGAPNSAGFGKCRNKPEDKDGFEDADGCPDLDNDQDGVLDVNDGPSDPNWAGFGTCRDTAEDLDGFEDSDGCPDLDNDSDGIPDISDGELDASGFGLCRNDPEDRDGFEDEDGCPDLDNDEDGTLDVDDGPSIDKGFPNFGICRDTPGPTAQKLKDNGVEPPYAYPGRYPGCGFVLKPQGKECGEFIITQKVQFGYNRATIKEVSFELLDAVADALIQHPWASSIRIEGHTDWHGSKRYNLSLSDRRAKAVRKYLTKKGVPAARLTSKGYGLAFPLNAADPRGVCERCTEGCACKSTGDATRAQNRRVQFRIMKVDQTDCPIMY